MRKTHDLHRHWKSLLEIHLRVGFMLGLELIDFAIKSTIDLLASK